MIADVLTNIKLNSVVVSELFIRGTKLNISCVYITQSYFQEPNNVRLRTTHYFIMQIAYNISSDIYFEGFMNL